MWRSNVLRLRKCSSAATWRNTKRYSSQTSLPITNEEFAVALRSVDGSNWWSRDHESQRLGMMVLSLVRGQITDEWFRIRY